MVCSPFLVLQSKYIQSHGRKLLPRPPRNQGQSKQYHQLKQLCNKKRSPRWQFDLNYQRGLLSLFCACSEVRITPHHENGLLHLHLGWYSIFPSETAETLAAARVSVVASFLATLVGPSDWIRTSGLLNPIQARYQTSPHPETAARFRRLDYITTFRGEMQAFFSIFLSFFLGLRPSCPPARACAPGSSVP